MIAGAIWHLGRRSESGELHRGLKSDIGARRKFSSMEAAMFTIARFRFARRLGSIRDI
jgi:hypothetical protein